jgi:putative salt-induced outer membrane protein YdiY
MKHGWNSLAGLAAALTLSAVTAADEIELANGDRLVGTVLEQTDETILFSHESLGVMSVDVANVTVIRTADAEAAVVVEAPEVALPAPEDESAWKSNFDLGLGGSFGNTDTQSVRAAITSTRETDTMRTALDSSYFFGSTDGDRTENRFTAGLLNDWLIPGSPWFYFATARYDNDQFQSWNYRIGLHGGVGYQLIDEEDFRLALRGGAGATREFGSIDDDWRPEALFGADLEWDISETQSIVASTVIYPDLDDTGEFRTVSGVTWRAILDAESNMNFNLRFEHEHQSDVDPGIDKNDDRIAAGLGFDF